MTLLLPLFVASISLLATSSDAQDCGRPYPARRVPRFPRQADFPNTDETKPPTTDALTLTKPYSYCGAVVVSDRFLLTAAYCVLNSATPLNAVRLGDLDLSRDDEANSNVADYEIESIIIHPNFTYEPETGVRYSDLALLKTARRIEFNEAVFPFCLSPTRVKPGTIVIGSGYGHVNETHTAQHLQEGELKVISAKDCEAEYRAKGKEELLRQAYPGLLQGAGVVCAGDPISGPCKGDEGGPLFLEDKSGRRFLAGIISFTGDVCGTGILPSISVSIADHYDFIIDVLRHG